MRILIVDDSAVMRKIVERALRLAGMEIEECLNAGDGNEALATLREAQNRLELILCDISMPVMDGLQFLEQREKEKLALHIPVVMITTEGGPAAVLRAVAAGAKGYIYKPFTADQVRLRVLPVMEAARAAQAAAAVASAAKPERRPKAKGGPVKEPPLDLRDEAATLQPIETMAS